MIVGIGTDLCRVSRVKHSLDRFGDTFARTYCNPREIEYAKRQLNPAMAFSQCLATKEAFAKAAGTGFNSDMWWDDVETNIADNGPSRLLISADAASLLKSKFEAPDGIRVHVSTSSTAVFCSAFVVIERLIAGSEPPR